MKKKLDFSFSFQCMYANTHKHFSPNEHIRPTSEFESVPFANWHRPIFVRKLTNALRRNELRHWQITWPYTVQSIHWHVPLVFAPSKGQSGRRLYYVTFPFPSSEQRSRVYTYTHSKWNKEEKNNTITSINSLVNISRIHWSEKQWYNPRKISSCTFTHFQMAHYTFEIRASKCQWIATVFVAVRNRPT